MAVVTVGVRPSADPAPAARDLAVFDLDRTLVRGSTLGLLARALTTTGRVRRRELARHALHEAVFASKGLGARTLERLCERTLRLARGHPQDDLREVAMAIVPQVVEATYPAARLLLEHHRTRADRLVLLSAAPQELVEAVAAALGFDQGLGTVAEVADGAYTGRLEGPFCHGPGKLVRLCKAVGPVDLRRATAYADSSSDLPMLLAVARPVAANPDRRLTAAARAAGWPILRFA